MFLIGSWLYYDLIFCQTPQVLAHGWKPIGIDRASFIILLRFILCGLPLFILMALSTTSKNSILQYILSVAVFLYAGWFVYVACFNFYDFVNPRLFYENTAALSFPVLLLLLITGPIVERMNVRDVTIYVTGLVMTVTIFLSVAIGHHSLSHTHGVGVVWGTGLVLLGWLFFGGQTGVCFVIAKFMKDTIPALIILFATIAYCGFFAWGWMSMDSEFGPLSLLMANFYSLSVMIPAWIAAIALNLYYVKKGIANV
jgi:hypothetical protein